MELTRTSPGLAPTRGQPALVPSRVDADASVADLATRLAQQGLALAAVELRRLGAEVRERQRHAVRAAVALYLSVTVGALAIAVLATASVLYFGRRFDDYAGAALGTGILLLALAVATGCILTGAARRLGGSQHGASDPTRSDERNPRHVP